MVRVTERMNPFPGLRPFEFGEEHLFFGREAQTDELLDRLHRNRFVAVIGSSGSGKSSLVRAGLLPALYSGFLPGAGSHWRLAIVHPGNSPIRNLAAELNHPDALGRGAGGSERQETANDGDRLVQALVIESTLRRGRLGLVEAVRQAQLPPHEHLIVVVDGLEALLDPRSTGHSQAEDDEATAFVKLLLAATQQHQQPIYVVVTLRSDYLGDCTRFAGLPEIVNHSQYLIPRMTRDQRRLAIEGPIGVAGGRIAPRLVQRMLNDVGDSLEQLPVLQHALMRTWDFWLGHHENHEPVDLRHYEAVGGMSEALSKHADRIYAQLTKQQQTIARRMFQLLTERGPDGRDLRRPATLQEIARVAQVSQEEVRGVVNRFRGRHNSFLMPPQPQPLLSTTVLNISHQSLMRVWTRLREWVKQEEDSARDYCRLAETAARYWLGDAELLQEPELTVALKWQQAQQPNSTWASRYGEGFGDTINYLERSRKARDREIEVREAAVAEQERLRKRRLGRVVGTAAGMAVVAGGSILGVILTGLHMSDANRARERAMNAEIDARILASESFQEAGQALEGTIEALTAGMQLQDSSREPEPYLAMRVAAQLRETVDGASEYSRLDGHEGAVYSTSFSPDGQAIASTGEDTTVKVWSLEGKELSTLQGHGDRSTSVSFSPDGTAIAAASSDGTIQVWNLQGEVLATFQGHEGAVRDVSFSPDGEAIASAGDDARVRVWDLEGEELVTLEGHEGAVRDVSFSPDGKAIASAGEDATVRVWDLDGEELIILQGHDAGVNGLSFSSDSYTLASASDDTTVKLWTVDGEELATLQGHDGAVNDISFASDGQTIASTGEDGTVILWNATSGQQIATLSGHDGDVLSASFSPDGHTLASAGVDGTVRLWNFQLDDLLARGCQQIASDLLNHPDVSTGDRQLCETQLSASTEVDDERLTEQLSLLAPSDGNPEPNRPDELAASADQPEPAPEPISDPESAPETTDSDASQEPELEVEPERATAADSDQESVDSELSSSPSEIATAQPVTPEPAPPAPAPRGRVTWPEGLILLSAPAGANVGGIGFNETVTILDISADGRWQRVRRESTGQEGWIGTGNLVAVTESSPAESSTSPAPNAPVAATAAPSLGGDRGRVTWPNGLAIRPVPQDGAAQIDGIPFNEIVTILDSSDDGRWQRVRRDVTGTEGWVKSGNIAALTTSPNSPTQSAPAPAISYRGRVTWRHGLAIRVEPRDGAAQIDGIPYYEVVTILSTSGDGRWQRVRRDITGTVGWVKAGNIALVR